MLEWLIEPQPSEGLNPDQQQACAMLEGELGRRLAEFGPSESGLDGYYQMKLEKRALLTPLDLGVIAFLRANRSRWPRIWDIGAGVGQVSAMLAIEGFEVIAVEVNNRRHAALAQVTVPMLEHYYPAARQRFHERHASFPEIIAPDDVRGDIALVLCCPFTAEEGVYETFRLGLMEFDAALVEFRALFVRVDEPGDEIVRAEAYCARYGLPQPEPVFRYDGVQWPGIWTMSLIDAGANRREGRRN